MSCYKSRFFLRFFQHDFTTSRFLVWSRNYSAANSRNNKGPEIFHPRIAELRERLEKEDKLFFGGTSHVFQMSEGTVANPLL